VFDHDVARWASTFLKVTAASSVSEETRDNAAAVVAAEASAQRRANDPGQADSPAGPEEENPALNDPPDLRSPLPIGLVTALEGFAMRPSLLVALDFDGVLAPIVQDPGAARPLPQSHRYLETLVGLPGVRLALVSGRTLEDLAEVASPPKGTLLVGSHGAEMSDPAAGSQARAVLDDDAAALLKRLIGELEQISTQYEGTHVEVKPTGVVLHTRRAKRAVAAKATQKALDGPATWPGVHLTEGKEVVELTVVPVTKGTALRELRAITGADAVLYAGDDVTDERAFAVLDGDAGDVSVRVGSGETAADHRLGSPDEVTAMLGLLVDLCRE
jgi:trehalose-phosphatase